MDYLYFGIIIIVTLFISLYFYKKNKKNSNVYTIQNGDVKNEENCGQEESIDEENKENTNGSEFDDYKMEIIYYWITQKVLPNKNIDYEILKETIIKTIGLLPEILEDMSGHYILNLSEAEFNKRLSKFDGLSLEEKLRLLIDRDLVSKTSLAPSASLIPLVWEFRNEESAAVWNIILTIH